MVILLALFGMVCWGIAPIFGKLGLVNVDPVVALCVRTLMAGTLVAGWSVGTQNFCRFADIAPLFLFFIFMEAVLATLVGDLAYYGALKWGNVNDVILIMSCSPLVTILVSHVFLGEPVTRLQLFGAVLIIGGLSLVSLQYR